MIKCFEYIVGMNEVLYGLRDKSYERKDELISKVVLKEDVNIVPNLNEGASRQHKMVELQKSSSSADVKIDRTKSEKFSIDRKYDSRDRAPYKSVNGTRPSLSGGGRRDDDRRASLTKPLRKPDIRNGNISSGSYRRETHDIKKSVETLAEPSKTLVDDSRLTKFIQRVQREPDRERRLIAAKQLVEYLTSSEGMKFATRNSDALLDELKEILFERGYKEVKTEVIYCIGFVGSLMGLDSQRYFQWLFEQVNSLIEDDVRALFLQALQETFKCYEKRQQVADFIPLVLNNLQTLLENADTPELLMSIVNVVMLITKLYPDIFMEYFRDTVDILVGWHIDSSQRDNVVEFTSQALISFQQFWVLDQLFTKELLGQFLEDMEAYVEELGHVMQDGHVNITGTPDEVHKIVSLLRVFSTVIRSLGEGFEPHKSRQLNMAYFIDVFDKMVQAIDSSVKWYFSDFIVLTANKCLILLLNLVRTECVVHQMSVLGYTSTILAPKYRVTNKYVTSTMFLTQKVIEVLGTKLPVTWITEVLGPKSILQSSKMATSAEVLKSLTAVYKSLLGLKNIPLLEETYRHLLGDTQQGYNILLESSGDDNLLDLVPNNPFIGKVYNRREAEAICIFNLSVLGEIGNTKNNLMGMWALSPGLFDLYCKHLDVVRPSISIQYPAVQYAILHSLYSHATRHGNFISTSSLLIQNTPLEGSILATSHYLSRLLKMLSDLLTHANTSFDSKLLALKWVSNIVSNLSTSPHAYTTRQFLTLVQALYHVGYDQEDDVAMSVQHCLTSLFSIPKLYPVYIVKGCVKLCMYRLNDRSEDISEAYLSLLCLLPFNVTTSKNNGLYILDENTQLVYRESTVGLPAMWQVCRTYCTHLPLGSFYSHNFRQVMGFLLHNLTTKHPGSHSWLESMYQAAQRSNNKSDWKSTDGGLIMQNYISNSRSVEWFWATWQAAQFCVLMRLKTPLGKPQETFTSIEAVLKGFAADINDTHEDDAKDVKNKNKPSSGHEQELRIKLLLQFMEQLEKQLFNAYEGAALSMPVLPKAVRTFFRTNKNTCLEWLSRVRMYMMKIALHCGLYTIVIRQASELLQDMKDNDNTQSYEFEIIIQYLVQALGHLHDADAVQGIYSWCKDVVGRKIPWIKASVEKAFGRYESAAKEYKGAVKSLLQLEGDRGELPRDTEISSVKPVDFVGRSDTEQTETDYCHIKLNMFANEIVDCYMQLNDWDSIQNWLETFSGLRASSTLTLPPPTYSVDMNFIKAQASYDSGEYKSVIDHLDLIPSLSYLSRWGLAEKVHLAQSKMLHASAILQEHTVNNHRSEIGKLLTEAIKECSNLLKMQGMDWPVLLSQDVVSLLTNADTILTQGQDKKVRLLPMSERLIVDESDHGIQPFMQAIRLVKLQQALSSDKNTDLSEQLLHLNLGAASLARKQHNYQLAQHLLLRQTQVFLGDNGKNSISATDDSLKVALKSLHTVAGINKLHIMRLDREIAKLLHCIGEPREAVDLLINTVVEYTCSDKARSSLCNELCSRSLLTLVKWLQVDHKMLSLVAMKVGQGDGVDAVSKNVQLLLDVEERASSFTRNYNITGASSDVKIGDNPILTDTDRIIVRLLNLSTLQCNSLSKSWYTLAGWCYKWGRKAIDNASHGSVQLFMDEKVQILNILPENTSHVEKECVLNILSQIHSDLTSEEDISDQDQSLYDDGTETTRRQLLAACAALQTGDGCHVDSLLDVWKGVVYRIYHYYHLSASAYFRFLKLNGETDPIKEITEDCNVISTLRLLRLLVKHAWELRSVLETGLAVTPTAPWKGIIPQLFSRLSHPEAYVRQSIADLLCRVAEDAPHLIVYPAVVGSATTKMETKSESGLLNNYLAEETDNETVSDHTGDIPSQDDDDLPELEAESILHNCILSMLNTLAANFPQMISDVKQLIEELRRITLLWDELWLGTLNQQHQDVERRISQLENEIKKVEKNVSLTKEERAAIILEKHKTVLKPTIYMMERLNEITSQPTETPHERWFQDTYGLLITNALEKLRNPPNPSHPRASWHPFKQIHVSLQQKAQKRNSLILSMEEISPKLYHLRNTVIAMPGLGSSGHIVTIESVSNTVQILPTKTKPKKLVFKGSDGKRYPYLFKGLEDLHLDERIMQFLNIVNNMFASGNKGSHELYRARHYSVTPLGPRSGLIQWVDGVTPLFGLYKRWQQREAQVQQNKQQVSGTSSGAPQQANILRPSEVYYNKLTPRLKEKGIKDLDNRKDWPLAVQRQVLEDLMSETPRDLLAKELWCTSTGPNEWWYVTQTYARSTAVMSMIGYIIGLGDRHLDNVLVDLSTGEVVHIDYNVCFEKGKGLRVPERVPFRLTQNIEAAFGITGIEGTFRLACEHVMKTLRKGRETLLTLLEAFVYDPLVDWTTGNEGGYTGSFYGGGLATGSCAVENHQNKQEMERAITTSMFSIRVAEMKVPWIQNRNELLAVLPSIQAHIDVKVKCFEQYSQCVIDEKHLEQLKQVVLEALSNKNSPIFTLQERYKEYLVIKTTQDGVNKMVEDKISECINWQQMHKHVMQKLQGSVFQKMCADIASSLNLGTPSFAAAKEFLQGAGQGSIIQQCEQVENELTSNLQVQRSNLHRVIDVLHTYGTIVSQFGVSFADNMRTSNYLQWLQALMNDFTENKCGEIVHHFHELYGDVVYPQTKVQLILGTDNRLQNFIQDTNNRLFKLLERRSLEKADMRYLDTQVEEGRALIENFVTENGQSGVSSLNAVIVTALCSLNKRNLQMEAAANSAGDRLMDLTSRDGDWFLEELCSMSANVFHFLDMMKSCQHGDDTTQISVLYKGMMATHHVYTALQDLNVSFRTVILPEALKIIQSQEPTVFRILSQLETILQEMGPLDSLIGQLETLHRNAVMGMKQENSDLLVAVQSIQKHFLHMLEGSGHQDLTPGQMLLMGFNGLFTRLDDEFGNLLDSMDNVQVPDLWKKVDVIREAKSLQLSSFTVNTRSLLSSLFFIRRLQVMHEFFHMCTQFAAAIQGLEGGNCYDDEQLSRPIKCFIADYVRKQVIGFPSQVLGYILCTTIHSMGLDVTAEIELKDIGAESKTPLDEICKKGVDLCVRNGQFQQVHLTQASSLTSNLDASWRRHDLTRRLDSNIELLKLSLQRTQLHVTRLHWLHEDLFIQAGTQPYHKMVANRSSIMSEVKKCMQALIAQEANLVACQSQYSQLESSITQRLKWAAGANPSLNHVLLQFEDAGLIRKQLAEEESKHCQEVISLCQGILHLEALRTRTPEAAASDTNFLSLVSRCNESCILATTSSCAVTEVEALLMEVQPLEDGQKTDSVWLKSTLKEISSRLKDIDKKQIVLKSRIDEAKDSIKTEVNSIRTLLTAHHKLMSDIRAILKTLAKQEEQEYGEHVDGGGIRDYLNLYKQFSENLTMALKLIVNDDFTVESLAETRSIIMAVQVQIPRIYEDLVTLAPPLVSNKPESRTNSPLSFATAVKKQSFVEESQLQRQAVLQKELLTITPPAGSPLTMKIAVSNTPVKKTEKITRDPKTGKAIQERNSYAIGVWRRVKMKLDGRDPDQNKRLSVAEQVDYVIKDAMSLDNLAVLYEGWTPWV